MKKSGLTMLSCVLLFLAQAQTNFTGTWAINDSKIDFGRAPHWILPAGFVITQDGKSITIERKLVDTKMVEHPYTVTLSFDGRATERTTQSGAKEKEQMKWSDDKQGFTLTSSGRAADGKPGSEVSELWSLEDGGKTLLVERHVEQPNGLKYTTRAYFDKK